MREALRLLSVYLSTALRIAFISRYFRACGIISAGSSGVACGVDKFIELVLLSAVVRASRGC